MVPFSLRLQTSKNDGLNTLANSLTNQPTLTRISSMTLNIDESLDLPIVEQELDTALKNTKLGKSPGPDGILQEVLVHGGNTLKAFLFAIISMFWVTEMLPSEIKDPNITCLLYTSPSPRDRTRSRMPSSA